MADRIKGITVEIGGDTVGLSNALKDVNKTIKDTQKELKDVDRLLKLDPNNTELLAQKQQLLAQQIQNTSEKLNQLRAAEQQVQQQFERGEIGEEQYRAFRRELQSTEQQMQGFQQAVVNLNREQEQVGQSTSQLNALFEATGTTVEDYANVIGNRLVTAIGNGTATARDLEYAFQRIGQEAIGSEGDIERLRSILSTVDDGNSIENIQAQLRNLQEEANRTEEEVADIGESLQEIGEKAKESGETLSAGLTAPIVALGIGAGLVASQFDEATGRIQSGLGLTAEEAKKLEEVARNLWKTGFGEDLNMAADAVVQVSKNLNELPADQLEKITNYAGILADRFELDIAQSTNSAGMIMNAFGGTAEEAFDLMTYGLQHAKGDGGELLDVFNEYAPQFKALGYSAEGFMATLIQGSQSGAFNFDLLGDAAKESFLLIGEGSDDVKAALSGMGLDSEKVIEGMNSGGEEAQKSFMAVSAAISGIKDPTEKTAAAIALFGTPIEDLGPQFQGFFSDVKQDLEGVEGSTQRAGDALYDNFGSRLTVVFRELQDALKPLGDVLMDMAEQVMPKISAAIEVVSNWFIALGPAMQQAIVVFGIVLAVIGPLLIAFGFVSTAISSIIAVVGTISGAIAVMTTGIAAATPAIGALAAVFTFITGPIGITIAAIAGTIAVMILAYNKIEWFREGVNTAWENIKQATSIAFGAIKEVVTKIMADVMNFIGDILGKLKAFWNEHGAYITHLVKGSFGAIWSTIKSIMGYIQGIFQVVWPIISGAVKTAWELIKLVVKTGLDIILGLVGAVMNLLKGDWEGAWNSIKQIGVNIWNNIESFFKGVNLKQIGKDIIQGLVNGIGSMKDAVVAIVKDLANLIPKWAKDVLGIFSPSRVLYAIGKFVGIGLANGIDSTKAINNKAMNELGGVIASAAKENAAEIAKINKTASAEQATIAKNAATSIAEIQAKARDDKRKLTASEVRKIAKIEEDADAKILANKNKHKEEIAKIEAGTAKERLDSIKKFIDDKKSLEQISLIDEVNIWRKAVDSFKDGTDEKIMAQQGYRDALAKVNAEITSINETYASKMTAISEKLRTDEEALTKAYTDTLNTRMSSLMSFAGIFDAFDLTVSRSGTELLANLNSQVDGFKLWQEEITKLSGKAIDEGLLAELQAMGPKALPELLALNSLTEEQLAEYSSLYQEKAALARSQAEAELIGMKQDTANRITELRATANTELAILQKEWTAEIKAITTATNNEFKTLTQIGKNAGQNLLNGLASMEGALVSQATAIAKAINDALQATLGGSIDFSSSVNQMNSSGKNASNQMGYMSVGSSSGMKSITTSTPAPIHNVYHVSIDGQTVDTFTKVVKVFSDLPQTVRTR